MPWSSDDEPEILTFLPADQLTAWDLTAKFSVKSDEKSDSGAIRWINTEGLERLDVLSPTGAVIARLTVTKTSAKLETDDEIRMAETPEMLIGDSLNFNFPVSALKFWIRGLDDPNRPFQSLERNGDGRAIQLVQDGWTIEYRGTVSVESGENRYEVPRRLTAKNATTEISWVSTEWQAIIQ